MSVLTRSMEHRVTEQENPEIGNNYNLGRSVQLYSELYCLLIQDLAETVNSKHAWKGRSFHHPGW